MSRGLASITLRVEFDPFARPTRNGRYSRIPAEDRNRRVVFSNGSIGSSSGCRRLAMPVFCALDLGFFLRRKAEVTTKVLSSSPISRGGPAKGKWSAEGGLELASKSPKRRSNSRSHRAAMAVSSNPLSSTR